MAIAAVYLRDVTRGGRQKECSKRPAFVHPSSPLSLRELQKKISKKIQISNEEYKHMADSHKRIKKVNERDFMIIKLRPKRFSSSTMKKLHAQIAGCFKIIKKIGLNAYVLELPPDFGISSTFNIFDLKEYIELALIPSKPFEPDPIFESEAPPECPPAISPD